MGDERPFPTVLYIPGMYTRKSDLSAMISDVGGALRKTGIGFQIVKKTYGLLSLASVDTFARRISQEIRTWFASHPDCGDIVLAGHSFGGMFARRVWLSALASEDPLDRWATRVRGFVLVGSPDRGVDVAKLHWAARISAKVLYSLGVFQKLLLSDGTKGSRFVTDLRLDWISNRDQKGESVRVAHILGTKDGLVPREDCLDAKQFARPWVIDLPDANHDQLVRPRRYKDTEFFVAAWEVAVNAVLGKFGTNQTVDAHGMSVKAKSLALVLSKLGGSKEEQFSQLQQKTIVFLLHGIRASNHEWPKKLAAIIRRKHPDWEVVTPSYGYFTAWRFALPWLRSRPVNWFKDQYTNLLDQHRNAVFHFVGHSNGTYAFGRSAQQCRGIRFDRVCLAGSVLPTQYDLDGLKSQHRIGMVRVDCSSRDWPVGLLCAFLSGLGMKDVGVAGVRGFQSSDREITTHMFHIGGHGRPLDDDHLPLIADFLDGTVVAPPQLAASSAWWLGWPSRLLEHPAGAYSVTLLLAASVLIPLYLTVGVGLTLAIVLGVLAVLAVLFDTI